jgi:rhodanese-related sulfurtransferase
VKGFLLKLVAIAVLAGVAAGVHRGVGGPLTFRPDEPERTVLTLPGLAAPSPADAVTPIEAGPTQAEPGQATPPPVSPTEGTPTDPSSTAPEPAGSGVEPAPSGGAAGAELVLDTLEIDLATARVLFEAGAADFVDARPVDEYEAGHIEGAMHVTPEAIRSVPPPDGVQFLTAERPVVVYCGGGDCHDSHLVAQRLQELFGLTRTHVFTGGFPAWQSAGLPVGTGPDPFAGGG